MRLAHIVAAARGREYLSGKTFFVQGLVRSPTYRKSLLKYQLSFVVASVLTLEETEEMSKRELDEIADLVNELKEESKDHSPGTAGTARMS